MSETSPFGVEWMRFEPDCEIRELIKGFPHVAFKVDDIEQAIARSRCSERFFMDSTEYH